MSLRPISFSGGTKSISDDDLCAACKYLAYDVGNFSKCRKTWPGLEDENGYVQECKTFKSVDFPTQNWRTVNKEITMGDFSFELGVVSDFLGNHWQQFLNFCEEHEINETRAEEVADHLDLIAGRG